MSKQISLRSVKGQKDSLKNLFAETSSYLKTLGFTRISIFESTNEEESLKNVLFHFNNEKVFAIYSSQNNNEEIKLIFKDLNVGMIYDIMTMKFQQISNTEEFIIMSK
ncbi:hypothetical protein HOD20_00490 [archaeon]|jgi:coproporphyrinogen III oxidase-like Fe-S oxidoreductase|nr:hypothetical protein [archaeon]MBT4350979.1 hypothetical protein [archaeon]MBT4647670.1 hypothetical protein [archaeon]MBT6822215.1 hypothetical protein [archaeon]MBT7391490.1 hypothetical protein [archaeon]